jgi:LysR family transcriptional regulator, transcriptional activator of nhaA
MEWLNYHHLYYFWTVVREGGVGRASKALRLAQPTISGQVRALEVALGTKLLGKRGRNVVPTETGQMVYRYADEIFGIGRELQQAVRGLVPERVGRLVLGITEGVDKMITRRILEPVLEAKPMPPLVLHEGAHIELLAELTRYGLDAIVSHAPVPTGGRVRAFAHLLGSSGMSWFAAAKDAPALRRRFPRSLADAPVILPDDSTPTRMLIDEWFRRIGITPRISAEIGDSALLKVLASPGLGAFVSPTAVADEICEQYHVKVIGQADTVVERYYLISAERRIRNPLIAAIADDARALFQGG